MSDAPKATFPLWLVLLLLVVVGFGIYKFGIQRKAAGPADNTTATQNDAPKKKIVLPVELHPTDESSVFQTPATSQKH